jgi:hypothetical protein
MKDTYFVFGDYHIDGKVHFFCFCFGDYGTLRTTTVVTCISKDRTSPFLGARDPGSWLPKGACVRARVQ